MDFKVNAVHFTADQKLVQFVQDKVKKLELIYDKIISSEVYLKLDKNDAAENKIAEVKILLPGSELFAKKQCKSFVNKTTCRMNFLKCWIMKTLNLQLQFLKV